MIAVGMLRTSYRLYTDDLWISIIDKICIAFTEKSSSLIFPWHPHGHIASMADATRTLRTCSRMKIMIRKSLNIFHIRKPAAIQRDICACVTGVKEMFTSSG